MPIANTRQTNSLFEGSNSPANPKPGTRWLNTADRLTWYWTGSHWRSEQRFLANAGTVSVSTTSGAGLLSVDRNYGLYLESIRFSGAINPAGTYDATNRWDFSVSQLFDDHTTEVLLTIPGSELSLGQNFWLELDLYEEIDTQNLCGLQARWNKYSNAASLIRPGCTLSYRLVRF